MSARYTLFVGNRNLSSWSLRPWLAMKTAKISFEDVVIRLHTAESKGRILAHSPSGKVPALKIEENGVSQTVWDSLAISETLAERHPEARLWPEAASARAHARSVVAEMHSGFQPLRRALSMEIAARHATPTLEDDVQADIARIVAIWTGALAAHGGEGGFLFGRFSIADAFFAPVVTRFETYAIRLPAAAQAYGQRILALPAMQEWIDAAKAEAARA